MSYRCTKNTLDSAMAWNHTTTIFGICNATVFNPSLVFAVGSLTWIFAGTKTSAHIAVWFCTWAPRLYKFHLLYGRYTFFLSQTACTTYSIYFLGITGKNAMPPDIVWPANVRTKSVLFRPHGLWNISRRRLLLFWLSSHIFTTKLKWQTVVFIYDCTWRD